MTSLASPALWHLLQRFMWRLRPVRVLLAPVWGFRLQSRDTQEKWNAALVTLREIVGLWGVGASFIVTGEPVMPQSVQAAILVCDLSGLTCLVSLSDKEA